MIRSNEIADLLKKTSIPESSQVIFESSASLDINNSFPSQFEENDLLLNLFGEVITSDSNTVKSTADFFKTDFIGNSGVIGTDTVILKAWKTVANISARLIEITENSVTLECLTDKEFGIYEEREVQLSLFEGYDLTIGNLFYLRVFERQNQMRIEIIDDPRLTSKNDFPDRDFKSIFNSSKLFKK